MESFSPSISNEVSSSQLAFFSGVSVGGSFRSVGEDGVARTLGLGVQGDEKMCFAQATACKAMEEYTPLDNALRCREMDLLRQCTAKVTAPALGGRVVVMVALADSEA